MQSTQTPTLVPLAFASNGTKNTIPEASQIGVTDGAASLNDGFPPLTMTPIAAGGKPPFGADMNGVLNLITQSIRWAHGGGRYAFSSTFAADANVSGYPAGAMLMSADMLGSWISLNDANTDNPDTGAGTKWVPGHQYGITPITGLTSVNVTLTPAQAAKSKITLAGTLTGNIQLIFPTWTKSWDVVNNTTGAFTITAKTASGTGIALAAGQQKITGDGTNITQPAESVATATQSGQPVQFGQVSGVVGQMRNLVMSVPSASASATLTADEIIVETALGGLRYCLASFNKTINLATTGAGGMDTGTAPASGYVAIYAIFNPTAQTAALLATNATSVVAPNVYSGALPSGYTASALVSVWPTNASGQFVIGYQADRAFATPYSSVASTTTQISTFTSVSAASLVPKNARSITGFMNVTGTNGTNTAVNIASSSSGINQQQCAAAAPSAGSMTGSATFGKLPMITQQTFYWTAVVSAGTFNSANVYICGYDI